MENILKQLKNNSKKSIIKYRFYKQVVFRLLDWIRILILISFSGYIMIQIGEYNKPILHILIWFLFIIILRLTYPKKFVLWIDRIGKTIVQQRLRKDKIPMKYGRYIWSDHNIYWKLESYKYIENYQSELPRWYFVGFEKNDYLYLLLGELKILWEESRHSKYDKLSTIKHLSILHKYDYKNYINNNSNIDDLDFETIINLLENDINNLSEPFSSIFSKVQ